MQDQIEQLFKIKHREGQKISLARLRHNVKQQKVDEQTINRIQKLKKYAIQDLSIPTQKLNFYYCSLCGQVTLVTNIFLQNMPHRKTDNAIAIDLRSNFIKHNFQKEKIKHIKRDDGIETQYRWCCECGIPIGYTSIPFDQFQSIRNHEESTTTNRPYLYVYEGAFVQRMKESKLVSELITYKETILLHLKKKAMKKG